MALLLTPTPAQDRPQNGHLPLLILGYYPQEQSTSIVKAMTCAGRPQWAQLVAGCGTVGRKTRARSCDPPSLLSINKVHMQKSPERFPSELLPLTQAPGRVAVALSPATVAEWKVDVLPQPGMMGGGGQVCARKGTGEMLLLAGKFRRSSPSGA